MQQGVARGIQQKDFSLEQRGQAQSSARTLERAHEFKPQGRSQPVGLQGLVHVLKAHGRAGRERLGASHAQGFAACGIQQKGSQFFNSRPGFFVGGELGQQFSQQLRGAQPDALELGRFQVLEQC